MFGSPARRLARIVAVGCLGLGLAGLPQRGLAQCLVQSGPAVFDSLNTEVGPPYFRTLANSMGVSASSRRLAVRYNYGFVVYSVANPSTPVLASVEDLLGQDGYPKSGDGQSRTGPIALSEDGQRVLVPWTDTAGIGTIAQAFGGSSFGPGGDYPPAGYNTQANVVAELGSPARYLGVTTTMQGLYVADVTGVVGGPGASVENGIRSERVTSLGTDLRDLQAVKVAGRSLVVGKGDARVVVIDVTNAGPSVPGLSSGFTWKEFSAAALGVPSGSELSTLAVAEHPTSHLLHILVQATKTTSPYGVTKVVLSRIVPGAGGTATVEPVGSFTPSSDASILQNGSLLLPFDSVVVAFVLNRRSTAVGGGLKLRVHSSWDFSTNLAESIAPITSPSTIATMVGFRSTGGNVHLYTAGNGEGHALSLDCTTAPSPATALLAVESVPFGGGAATAVPDQGSVFIGDQLRIKPAFSPADTVKPLLDWRLDYDFHDGNAADSQTPAMRLIHADASRTLGPPLPPSELTLVGPCDPAQVPQAGPPPDVSTGDGCWASVTTNGDYGIPLGTPDFSASAPASQQLKIAFEVQNALNEGGSSVATHRITWKVPQQGLKSGSVFSGDVLEDGSEGSPSTTGFRWYFARVPVGETGADVLTLEQGCDGPTCSPAFFQVGQTVAGLQRPGDYRYWVSVPYRGGFRTAECPGLDGNTCTGLSTKTVKVTEVVLTLTAPTQLLVGTSTFNTTSTSKKAGSVAPCPSTSTGFTYDICEVVSGACTEGTYVSTGLSVSNPFPTSGSGTITIPTPAAGTRGLRIRYSYSTGGSCASPSVAQWPAGGGWAPITVLQAVPSIRLRNSTDTSDLPKSLGIVWELLTGQTARPYAEVNGARDMNPPAGLAWSYRLVSSSQETAIGTTQGASFSVATTGDYKLILRGYGADVEVPFGVSSGGGGGGTPPTVSAVTFSRTKPAVGEIVTISCVAARGTYPIGSYQISFGDGLAYSGTAVSTSHGWAAEGTKTVGCIAYDVSGLASAARSALIDVGGPDVGPTVTAIVVEPEFARPGTSATLTCSATPPEGRLIAGYEFDFGDSSPLVNGPSNAAAHVYQAVGTYSAICRAYDATGRSGSLQKDVVVHAASYSLQVNRIGFGSGLVTSTPSGLSCGSICSKMFATGETVTLDTLPTAGSRFAGWSGSGCTGLGPCSILMSAARRVTANFLPDTGAAFYTITPCRVADTRRGSGIPLAAGETRAFPIVGTGCLVSTTQAATLNVTVTQPTAQGFLTVFPSGLEAPVTQSVAFSPGRTRAAPTIVQIGDGGSVSVYNVSAGTVDVILDVTGAFQ